MGAAEAAAEVRVGAGQAIHRGGAEGHKQRLDGGRGCRRGLREELEASSDQHGAATSKLELKGLGGQHATHEAPL